jgi:hypothetical protein
MGLLNPPRLLVVVLVIEFFGWERPDSAAARFRRSAEFPFPGGDVSTFGRSATAKPGRQNGIGAFPAKEFDNENDHEDD